MRSLSVDLHLILKTQNNFFFIEINEYNLMKELMGKKLLQINQT